MGDQNQYIYLEKFLPSIEGSVLEIGSKDYGSTMNFRGLYPDNDYVGLDLEDGKGVDIVHDLTQGVGELASNSFDLMISCSVLEHVDRPWVMAEHMETLLKPGGKMYISVPWVWRYHPYPDDYFRFSHRGIKSLFPSCSWEHLYYSTYVPGEFFAIDENNPTADNDMAVLKKIGNDRARKYLPYLMVNMLGTKHES
jgi:SAM-dependent methyltransferase